MTASLHHAKPLLSAAVNSGFRESGVQSLKNLDDPNSCPMVAVRTAGLGLEAIIASVIEENEERPGHFQHLVANDYGIVLLRLANKRFEANQQRIEKFRVSLREVMASETTRVLQSETWESPEARRQRKRDQGLRDQAAAKAKLAKDIDFKTLVSSEDDRGHLRLHPND
jgi:tRNA wybutosine-synthesizing protein 3